MPVTPGGRQKRQPTGPTTARMALTSATLAKVKDFRAYVFLYFYIYSNVHEFIYASTYIRVVTYLLYFTNNLSVTFRRNLSDPLWSSAWYHSV
jgi:hypothetical protein